MPRQPSPASPVRGRPRDPRTRAAILTTARALLAHGGLTAVTIEAISQKAGVSRPTIYRYWPNAPAVAMAAFLDSSGAAEAARSPGNPIVALREQLHALADAFAAPAGRSVAAMVAAAQSETELAKAFRNEFIARNRDATRALLERCVDGSAIEAPHDMELTLDLIFGPLFYRLLMGHAPITRDFVDRLVDAVIRPRG